MSETGWKTFVGAALAAKQDGLEDWVVLHGGATAVYRVGSMSDAARLAGAIAEIPGLVDRGVLLTISDRRLSVRLTRDLWSLEAEHVDLARAVSAVARAHESGAVADRGAVQEVQIAIAAKGEMIDLKFWRAVLGYDPMAEDNGVDPLGHSSTVWMQEIRPEKSLRHAMHLDVSVARSEMENRLKAALAAGGRIVDESHAPSHWTLADRAGNRVCICAWPDGSVMESVEEEP